MMQILQSALLQTLASSLLPTLPDFGKVTLNFCVLFWKREEASATSQSCQRVSGRWYTPELLTFRHLVREKRMEA